MEWFEVIDPTRQRSLDVQAVLSAGQIPSRGNWSMDSEMIQEWTSVDTGTETTAVDGVISTLDLSSIPLAEVYEKQPDETIAQRLERVNQPAVTL